MDEIGANGYFGYFSYRKLLLFSGFLCTISLAGLLGLIGGGFFGNYRFNSVAIARISQWNYSLEEAQHFAHKNQLKHYQPGSYTTKNLSFDDLKDGHNPFNIKGRDVLVFLHIQKTAGTTFEKFLTRHLENSPCDCSQNKKKCKCFRPNTPEGEQRHWLFSRYSTGWSCGLHADWTELVVSNCVDNVLDRREVHKIKRRYFYTTFLREPMGRYISEFRHVSRGATWGQSRHICNGRPPTPMELPWCFDPDEGWEGVTLDEFLDCPFNLATNRQTRMLADLTLVGCYNQSTMTKEGREMVMLESAKRNLYKMAFFGLQEEMEKSQLMFEQLFHLSFKKNMGNWNKSKSEDTVITDQQEKLIKERNHLDFQLYEYGKELFHKRFSQVFAQKKKVFDSDIEDEEVS